jgi:hypothetical protein
MIFITYMVYILFALYKFKMIWLFFKNNKNIKNNFVLETLNYFQIHSGLLFFGLLIVPALERAFTLGSKIEWAIIEKSFVFSVIWIHSITIFEVLKSTITIHLFWNLPL